MNTDTLNIILDVHISTSTLFQSHTCHTVAITVLFVLSPPCLTIIHTNIRTRVVPSEVVVLLAFLVDIKWTHVDHTFIK